jgi:hypothetical protein
VDACLALVPLALGFGAVAWCLVLSDVDDDEFEAQEFDMHSPILGYQQPQSSRPILIPLGV